MSLSTHITGLSWDQALQTPCISMALLNTTTLLSVRSTRIVIPELFNFFFTANTCRHNYDSWYSGGWWPMATSFQQLWGGPSNNSVRPADGSRRVFNKFSTIKMVFSFSPAISLIPKILMLLQYASTAPARLTSYPLCRPAPSPSSSRYPPAASRPEDWWNHFLPSICWHSSQG